MSEPKPRIYVTHHVREAFCDTNDLAIAMLWHLEKLTTEPHETVLALWHPPGEEHLRSWLEERLPPNVEVLFNDRPGRPDVQPSLRNLCVMDARRRGPDQLMALLHADARVSIGWLQSFIDDLPAADAKPVILQPRFAPYLCLPSQSDAPPREYPDFWEKRVTGRHKCCIDEKEFGVWVNRHGVPSRDSEIVSMRKGYVDGAGGLMMFFCRAGVFDHFGLCDEAFTGINYDDDDWALRAMASGVLNLQCNGVWISHMGSTTFGVVKWNQLGPAANNWLLFKEKWKDLLAEVGDNNGALWNHLRHGHPKAAAPVGPFYELEELRNERDAATDR